MCEFPHSMKPALRISSIGLLLLAGVVLPGCSTSNPNPATPHANTGYIDFYTDSNLELSWEVKRFETESAELKTVFSQFEPVQGSILRIAAAPGRQRYQVWIANRVTEGPEFVDVRVENAKVTPVHVTLTTAGTTSVDRKVYGLRPSAKGYGRGTKIVMQGEDVFRIGTAAEVPRNYQTKERMPYWSLEAK
jgi:hypothetical protein